MQVQLLRLVCCEQHLHLVVTGWRGPKYITAFGCWLLHSPSVFPGIFCSKTDHPGNGFVHTLGVGKPIAVH